MINHADNRQHITTIPKNQPAITNCHFVKLFTLHLITRTKSSTPAIKGQIAHSAHAINATPSAKWRYLQVSA